MAESKSYFASIFRVPAGVWLLLVLTIVAGVAVHVSSYHRSVSVTAFDVTLAEQEGLVVLNVPLTGRAPRKKSKFEARIWVREGSWESNGTSQIPLRAWMARLKVTTPHGMFADFGYWKGDWQSDARPGPFVVVFVPIWFVTVLAFGVGLIFYYRPIRFSIRTLLCVTAIIAILVGAFMWIARVGEKG